ncbi:hypothetical protein SCLCIDRAFT_820461 [Scleroderma citrinum Foug A]|uniref:Uncharacterized protein n=1 Tax=Scleroderma citrinum Foug A TaxID=1036808 RepID=A0A0C3AW00_9AGAM|nr:hypothetical protein SCLCIDRAFT_820461 [Scleroderma citrinum Foug A]
MKCLMSYYYRALSYFLFPYSFISSTTHVPSVLHPPVSPPLDFFCFSCTSLTLPHCTCITARNPHTLYSCSCLSYYSPMGIIISPVSRSLI